MPQNQYITFAAGAGANVFPYATYAARTEAQTGVQSGTGSSTLANNTWRQSSVVAAMIGQFTADNQNQDVLDDGNVATFEAKFEAALLSCLLGQSICYIVDSGSADALIGTPSPALTSYDTGQVIVVQKGSSSNATTTPTININGLGTKTISKSTGSALLAGDLPGNIDFIAVYDGSKFRKIGLTTSDVAAGVQAGQWTYIAASGTDTYTGSPASSSGSLTSLSAGACFLIHFVNGNATTTPTLNIDSIGAKTIIKQSGAAVVAGDCAGYLPVIFDGTYFRISGAAYSDYINPPPPGNTFYVNGSTGNDNNPGTSALPFATIQGAVNKIAYSYLTNSQVTVNVASGTYGGVSIPTSFIASWLFVGNPSSPSSCIVSSTSSSVYPARGFAGQAGVVFEVNGFSIASYYENIAATNGGECTILNVIASGPTSGAVPAFAAYSGNINFYGPITYSGNALTAVGAFTSGQINFGYHDVFSSDFTAWTINGAPAFSTAFAVAASGGVITMLPSQYSFTGSATGPRYLATLNGVINTQGGGANVFPGSTAGTAPTGLYA